MTERARPIELVRRHLQSAQRACLRPSPAGLHACANRLAAAAAILQAADPTAEVVLMRDELRRVGELIEAARRFHCGWRELAGPGPAPAALSAEA